MTKEEVRLRIDKIGIIPAIRVASTDDAEFASEAVFHGGIPVVEITMTVPGAIDVIRHLRRTNSEMVVGAGSVWDAEMGRHCMDAGAMFLTSTGLDLGLVELARKEGVLVFPGALTPTEIMQAWKAGSDMVKVFPCSQMGGEVYIRALKAPLPQIPLIAAGGVNQATAASFILAGAAALGIGAELTPKDSILQRNRSWIVELAGRFAHHVKVARDKIADAQLRSAAYSLSK